jgi:hypothetical protein
VGAGRGARGGRGRQLASLPRPERVPSARSPAVLWVQVVESAKWQAWSQLGNMAAMEAMRLYVQTLDKESVSSQLPAPARPPRGACLHRRSRLQGLVGRACAQAGRQAGGHAQRRDPLPPPGGPPRCPVAGWLANCPRVSLPCCCSPCGGPTCPRRRRRRRPPAALQRPAGAGRLPPWPRWAGAGAPSCLLGSGVLGRVALRACHAARVSDLVPWSCPGVLLHERGRSASLKRANSVLQSATLILRRAEAERGRLQDAIRTVQRGRPPAFMRSTPWVWI